MQKRYPMPQPFGWYHVAFSGELKPGDIFPLIYFGEHLVLFRTDAGQARLLDAFCPHLGAHLGYGGKVQGDDIVCPFHAWRFSGDGICVDVPYAATVPKVIGKPCLRSWSVKEANRSIYAWYHPRRAEPIFDVVPIPGFHEADDEWTDFLHRRWTVRCHIQEAHENLIDTAHFQCVHEVNPAFEISFNGHHNRIVMDSASNETSFHSRVITETNGPGQSWARYEGFPEFIVLNPITPIDDDCVVFHIAVAFRKRNADRLRAIHQKVLADICQQVERDIPIFENKIYRVSPLYCDGDGPIQQFREWYRQFYVSY